MDDKELENVKNLLLTDDESNIKIALNLLFYTFNYTWNKAINFIGKIKYTIQIVEILWTFKEEIHERERKNN